MNYADPFGLWQIGIAVKGFIRAGIGYLFGSKGVEASVTADGRYYSGTSGTAVRGLVSGQAGMAEESPAPHAEAAAGVAAQVLVGNLDNPEQEKLMKLKGSLTIPGVGTITLRTGRAADGSSLWQLAGSRAVAKAGVSIGPSGVKVELPGGEKPKPLPAPSEPKQLPPGGL